jgi:hypothetical protein
LDLAEKGSFPFPENGDFMNDVVNPIIKQTRPMIKVIFELCVPKPKITFYRGVQATDGGFRMEKRGLHAKAYRAFMWCGSVDGLYQHRDAVEAWYGPLVISPASDEAGRQLA